LPRRHVPAHALLLGRMVPVRPMSVNPALPKRYF
jgi:hypothetical protein